MKIGEGSNPGCFLLRRYVLGHADLKSCWHSAAGNSRAKTVVLGMNMCDGRGHETAARQGDDDSITALSPWDARFAANNRRRRSISIEDVIVNQHSVRGYSLRGNANAGVY